MDSLQLVQVLELTTAWRGSSRSSSPDFPLSWPFLPLGGIVWRGDSRVARKIIVAGVVVLE
jgi:hypothetical protein